MHYEILTEHVIKTRLSGLGNKAIKEDGGETTPALTLNKFLNAKKEYFIRTTPGTYKINPSKIHDNAFAQAKHLYKESLKKNEIVIKTLPEEIDLELKEGELLERFVSYYERDRRLVYEAKKIHGTTCMVSTCKFDFKKHYGEQGRDYIEVHHIVPLFEKGQAEKVNPKTDMVVVCANCHRIIHRERNKTLSIDEVAKLILENKVSNAS